MEQIAQLFDLYLYLLVCFPPYFLFHALPWMEGLIQSKRGRERQPEKPFFHFIFQQLFTHKVARIAKLCNVGEGIGQPDDRYCAAL